MSNPYRPKHLKIYELVDKETYESTPEWKLWLAFDPRVLMIADLIKEEVEKVMGTKVPMTVNNWKWGGDRSWSGLRNPKSPWYSTWSQHSFGRAIDAIFKGVPATEVRKIVRTMMDRGDFKHITDSITVEHTLKGKEIGWLHIDVRNNKPGYNELHL